MTSKVVVVVDDPHSTDLSAGEAVGPLEVPHDHLIAAHGHAQDAGATRNQNGAEREVNAYWVPARGVRGLRVVDEVRD